MRIRGYLNGEDPLATLDCLRKVGVTVEGSPGRGRDIFVSGVGLFGPRPAHLDFRNASTPQSLMAGWLAGQDPARNRHSGAWIFTGDDSLVGRPVARLVDPLRLFGADADYVRLEGFPPYRIVGTRLAGGPYDVPVVSAQVKSCLLFAALTADSAIEVTEAIPTRDHSEKMLAAAGVPLTVKTLPGEHVHGTRITVEPVDRVEIEDVEVLPDFSSAAFFIAAALLVPRSELVLRRVGVNRSRTGLLNILSRMGARVEVDRAGTTAGEDFADIVVRHSQLGGTTVHPFEVPACIDELPLVALLGAFAQGDTLVTGAHVLRAKESDRIDALASSLRAIGVSIETFDDGFCVHGTGGVRGGRFAAHADHRLAMVGAIAGLVSSEGVHVDDLDCASVSYPGFESDLAERIAAPFPGSSVATQYASARSH